MAATEPTPRTLLKRCLGFLGSLGGLLAHAPAGFHVEPVYAEAGVDGYRYARKFTLGFLGCPPDAFEDA